MDAAERMQDVSDPLDELYAQVQEKIARDRGPRAWLSSRPTWARVATLLGVGSAVLAIGLLLSASVSATAALSVAALAVIMTLTATAALRPLHRPAWSARTRVAVGAVLAASAIGAIAYASDGTLGELAHGACAAVAIAAGLPVFLTALLLDRRPPRGAVFGALGAGVTGAAVTQLMCPASGLGHLLLEHAAAIVALTALGALGAWMWRRPRFTTR